MNWLSTFLTSSIGKKLIMSLTGIFLILFLLVHLIGNFQLLANDGGQAFNIYTYFMTHNPLIKTISYGLYATILLHAIQGLLLWKQNKSAAGGGGRYAVLSTKTSSYSARNMAWLGTLVLIFLFIHMKDFWYIMKFTDELPMISYPGLDYQVKDMYQQVATEFKEPFVIVIYVLSMIALAFHLLHGFGSSFQSLGVNHPKYTPIIEWIGKAYGILIPLGFAAIPIIFYFTR